MPLTISTIGLVTPKKNLAPSSALLSKNKYLSAIASFMDTYSLSELTFGIGK